MADISLIGYATLMNPQHPLAVRYRLQAPDSVLVNSAQRFFGFPDIAGKDPRSIFGTKGNLVERRIGATTVRPHHSLSYNAVIYRDIPSAMVDELDRIERASHLERVSVPPATVTRFSDGSSWTGNGSELYIYRVTTPELELDSVGRVRLLRDDVLPNAAYLAGCRQAAALHGRAFAEFFEDTTFLADGATPIRDFKP